MAISGCGGGGGGSQPSGTNSVNDTATPAVSITTPGTSAPLSGTATFSATASDGVGVTKVEFYVNGALKATDTATPYTYNWNTTSVANGIYTLTAKAYDAAGNVGQSSNVMVTVSNAGGGQPTTAIVKLATSGTIPPGIPVPVINTVLNYATNKGLSIGSSNITTSGVGSGLIIAPNTGIAGQVGIQLASFTPITQAGEIATLTFSIAPGNFPSANDFTIAPGSSISGIINGTSVNIPIPVIIQSITTQ